MPLSTIQDVLAIVPELNRFGIGLPQRSGRSAAERKAHMAELQAELLAQSVLFDRICGWLNPLAEKVRRKKPAVSSYRLKHVAERYLGTYVPNGVFIAAAISCGIPYKVQDGLPNVLFGVNEMLLKEGISGPFF